MGNDFDDLNAELRERPKRRTISVLMVIGLMLAFSAGVYAAWNATHTFPIPAQGQPIGTVTFSGLNFILNAASNTVYPAGSFIPTSDTKPIVNYTLTGASGLTIETIVLEVNSCSSVPPNTNVITTIPVALSPGLIRNTQYNYCIYYSSGASIASGSLVISYSG